MTTGLNRAAGGIKTPVQRAGVFAHGRDASQPRASGLADVLLTGILVVYPALATVAVIVVTLVMSGGGA